MSVKRRSRPRLLTSKFSFIQFNLHCQQRAGQGLALRIRPQRQRTASAERPMQDEIQRSQIGQFVALYGTQHPVREVALHRAAVSSRTKIG